MPRAADDFIIEGGVLTRGGKLLLYASAGAGKTTVADHLAGCLASCTPFLGRFAIDRTHRVLFVQGELAPAELASHGQNLLEVFGASPASDGLIFWLNKQLKLPRGLGSLRAAVELTRASVLVIDPFIRFFGGQNTRQPEEVGEFFESLDRLLDDPGLGLDGVVVLHHMNVAHERTAGSWAFEGWPSTIVRLDPVKGRPDCRRLLFEKVRSPDSTLFGHSIVARLGDQGYVIDDGPQDNTNPQGRGITVIADFLTAAGGEALRHAVSTHLQQALGIKQRQATNILGSARDLGVVVTEKVGREVLLRLVQPFVNE
ncbi:MAG: hypothetical protein C0498_10720 [Anaerolinea sp.]|jgi:hypothetical protein|nr:hypothetical protein [Anaerolinea sp.]